MALENRCFADCKGLKTVYLFSNITDWGDETFMDCTTLEKVYIGFQAADTPIERIGTAAFKNCTGLAVEGAVEFRTVVKSLGKECFKGCSSLPSIAINTTVLVNLVTIEDSVFEDCAKLRTFLNSKYTALTTIGKYAFRNCDVMAQPSIPAGVTSIGEGCFMDCDNLKYVSFYGALEEYPKDCFKNCPNLIRTGGTAAAFAGLHRIGEDAYAGCTSLTSSTSWNLGRYTALEEIGDGAFTNCTGLTYATLSATLTKLGNHVFDGCTGMGLLTFNGTEVPEIGSFSLETMGESFAIRVPDSQAEGDPVYLSYLKRFTELLGEEQALRLLDSATDGAKERYEAGTKETETAETAGVSEDTKETTEESITEKTITEQTTTDTSNTTEETPTEETKEETDK